MDLSKISLKDILQNTAILLSDEDVLDFCEDKELIEQIQEYLRIGRETSNNISEELTNFLIDNEDKISKEKFILCLMNRYVGNIKYADDKIGEIVEELLKLLLGDKNIKLSEDEELLNKCISAVKQCTEKEKVMSKLIQSYIKAKQYNKHEEVKIREIVNENYTKRKLESLNIIKRLYFEIVLAEHVEQNFKMLRTYLKGNDVKIYKYYFDEKNNQYAITIISSKKLSNDNAEAEHNIKRLDEMKSWNKNKTEEENIARLIQSIELEDFKEITNDEDASRLFCIMIAENIALKTGMTPEDIKKMRENNDENADSLNDNDLKRLYIKAVVETVTKYADQINIDKMLLIAAYRLYYQSEEENIAPESMSAVREVLEDILNIINNPKARLTCNLEFYNYETQENISKNVDITVADLQRCLKKFIVDKSGNTLYITDKQIKEYKEKIERSEIDLAQIDSGIRDIVLTQLTQEEQEQYSLLSDNNLITMIRKNQWNPEKIQEIIEKKKGCNVETLKILLNDLYITQQDIQELYLNGAIDLNAFNDLIVDNEFINTSNFIEFYKKAYLEKGKKEEQEKNQKQFKQYAEAFKKKLLQDAEKIDDTQNELMQEIIEQINEKDADRAIAILYKEGILDLKTVIDWCQEDALTFLIKEVSLEQIITDINNYKIKVSYESMAKAVYEYIKTDGLSYKERMKWITSGFITGRQIGDLYIAGYIETKEELYEMVKVPLINHVEAEDAISIRGDDSIVHITGLCEIGKRVITDDKDKNGPTTGGSDPQQEIRIIAPYAREDYIMLFNARLAETTDIDNPENPFYNYHFYVITDEDGKRGANSIVIAERYHNDKDKEDGCASGNATYIFKYKDRDLLKECQLKNDTKELYNSRIFRAMHTVKSETRNGAWAYGVLKGIIQVMLESDLSEYKTDNERRDKIMETLIDKYGLERTAQIIEMIEDIDIYDNEKQDNEKFIHIITPTGIQVQRKKGKNTAGGTQSDDDDVVK